MTIILGENRGEDLDGQPGQPPQPGQPARLKGDLPSSPWSIVPWRSIVAGVVVAGAALLFAPCRDCDISRVGVGIDCRIFCNCARTGSSLG